MQTDVYFRWYDLNINAKEQDDRNMGPIEALQARIRKNTGNSIDISKDQEDLLNGQSAVREERATENANKLSVASASSGNVSSTIGDTVAKSMGS